VYYWCRIVREPKTHEIAYLFCRGGQGKKLNYFCKVYGELFEPREIKIPNDAPFNPIYQRRVS